MMRCWRLRRLAGDTEGGVMVETVIVLPVLLLLMMLIMEMSLILNTRQLANHAAFCAARTASVYGVDSTAKTHLAAAMAMSSISPGTEPNGAAILGAYGLPDPAMTVQTLCNIPGFQGQNAAWLRRLAIAYVRTGEPACSTGTAPGKTRKYVVARVTYIHRCAILPLGVFWGTSGLDAYIAMLKGLSFYEVIASAVDLIENSKRWNVPVHGRAVMDYWAD